MDDHRFAGPSRDDSSITHGPAGNVKTPGTVARIPWSLKLFSDAVLQSERG